MRDIPLFITRIMVAGTTLFIIVHLFVTKVTPLPTSGVRYWLYGMTASWNEAKTICESHGQDMVKLDTSEKYHNFVAVKDRWLQEGSILDSLWLGLHRVQDAGYQWYDCDVLTSPTFWGDREPNSVSTDMCVRFNWKSNDFRTKACNWKYQVVCQKNVECEFGVYPNMEVIDTTLASSRDIGLRSCQRSCVNYSGSGQCVAITFVASPRRCNIYIKPTFVLGDKVRIKNKRDITVYTKRCILREYQERKACDVPLNSERKPISACPQAATKFQCSSEVTSKSPSTVTIPVPSETASSSSNVIKSSPKLVETTTVHVHKTTTAMNCEHFTSTIIVPETSTVIVPKTSTVIVPMTSTVIVPKTSTLSECVTSTDVLSEITTVCGRVTSTVFVPETSTNCELATSTVFSYAPPTECSPGTSTVFERMTSTVFIPDTTTVFDTVSCEDSVTQTVLITSTSTLQELPSSVKISLDPTKPASPMESRCWHSCLNRSDSVWARNQYEMIDRKKLSSYRRSKTSALDERASTVVVGGTGVGFTLFVVAFFLCFDTSRAFTAFKRQKYWY